MGYTVWYAVLWAFMIPHLIEKADYFNNFEYGAYWLVHWPTGYQYYKLKPHSYVLALYLQPLGTLIKSWVHFMCKGMLISCNEICFQRLIFRNTRVSFSETIWSLHYSGILMECLVITLIIYDGIPISKRYKSLHKAYCMRLVSFRMSLGRVILLYITSHYTHSFTHWDLDNMAIISQTIFSNLFFWTKKYEFQLTHFTEVCS